jgi:hypothetical protein
VLNGCFSPPGRNKKSRDPHKNMLCHEYRQFTIVHKKGNVKTGDSVVKTEKYPNIRMQMQRYSDS